MAAGSRKREEKREKNKTRAEEYCGKIRAKDKKDLDWVKPVSSGTSKKKLHFIRFRRKEEEQKSRRKLEAE